MKTNLTFMVFRKIFRGLHAGADLGILVRGSVKVAGRGPDQPTSETYILKSFFLQIRLLLDTLNQNFKIFHTLVFLKSGLPFLCDS